MSVSRVSTLTRDWYYYFLPGRQ